MQFKTMFFWEFIQNLPLVAGLLLAIQLWQETLVFASITTMITGSLLGALLIRLTESNILGQSRIGGLQENREPITVTLTNIFLMFVFMFGLTVYLTAAWSSPLTDILAGALIGFILSAGQSLAARRTVNWRHSAAFAAAFPAALISIRFLSTFLPLILSILLITVIVTLIITYVDYGHLTTIGEGAN